MPEPEIINNPQNKPTEPIKPEGELTKTITIKKKEYTYEEIKRLFGILGNQTRLAAILNCIPQYITYLKENDPLFREALELGKDYADGLVINALHENCVKYKDVAAQKFYLTNKIKDEYAEKSKQEIEHKGSVDLAVKELSNQFDPPQGTASGVTPK